MHPQEGHIRRGEGPFGQELHSLSASEFIQEVRGPWTGSEETVDLEGDHRTWVQSQGTCVLGKVGQRVLRVEEPNHGDTGGHVH